jgi:hypothetical protein
MDHNCTAFKDGVVYGKDRLLNLTLDNQTFEQIITGILHKIKMYIKTKCQNPEFLARINMG